MSKQHLMQLPQGLDCGSLRPGDSAADSNAVAALERLPMGLRRSFVVLVCILLNALDGFDVLAISFAAPGIAAEWGLNHATLGIVLSMELVGMTIGSLALGLVADRHGRRRVILTCLVLMVAGMFAASLSETVLSLAIVRLVTGLGLGGMLTATSAMVVETCHARGRNMAVALMAAGYPIGALLGGGAVTHVLDDFGWRSIFAFGAIASAVALPVAWLALPETASFLSQSRRSFDRTTRLNRTMSKLGLPGSWQASTRMAPVTAMPLTMLFGRDLFITTILLSCIYLGHITTFYYVMKWAPKIAVDIGATGSAAGSVLVAANLGGAVGSLLFSILSRWFRPVLLAFLTTTLSATAVVAFGYSPADIDSLRLTAAAAGFFTMATVVSFYAIFAQSFPVSARATGVGFVLGVGRGGAAVSPVLAGLLFGAGLTRGPVAAFMALGSIMAALLLLVFVWNAQRARARPNADDEITDSR